MLTMFILDSIINEDYGIGMNILFAFLDFLIVAGILFVIIFFPTRAIARSRRRKFVKENSLLLEELTKEYNSIKFYDVGDLVFEQDYDNENMFYDLRPFDLLVYKLDEDDCKAMDHMFQTAKNKQLWNKFLEFKNKLSPMRFKESFKGDSKKIQKIEEEFINEICRKPNTEFKVVVKLNLYNMSDWFIDQQIEEFDANQVREVIERVNDKRGDFYNDPAMWDSICKIERAKVTNKLRFYIYNRDDYTCQMCGKDCRYSDDLEVDHIIPISKGGKSVPNNLQSLCHKCNKEKGNKIY